jgi:hypothetical protein
MSNIGQRIAELNDELNRVFKQIQEYKNQHPESRSGYYIDSYGSLLNAYREGDIGFDECIKRLEAIAKRTAKEQRHACAEAVMAIVENEEGPYGQTSKEKAHQAVMNAEVSK